MWLVFFLKSNILFIDLYFFSMIKAFHFMLHFLIFEEIKWVISIGNSP